MLNLDTVNWRGDGITRDFVERNRRSLEQPMTMSAARLGEAVTYCRTIDNPFAHEMMRRSLHLENFKAAKTDKERSECFKRSCAYHGIFMG